MYIVVAMHTHTEVLLDKAEDDVSTDEDTGPADAGAAVHCDGPFGVHRAHVADKAHQLLGRAWSAVVWPCGELQMLHKVSGSSLEQSTGHQWG